MLTPIFRLKNTPCDMFINSKNDWSGQVIQTGLSLGVSAEVRRCEFEGCDRSFGSYLGLRIHQGKVHAPNGVKNNPKLQKGGLSKDNHPICSGAKRWSEEELRILAREEFPFRDLHCSTVRFVAPVVMDLGLERNFNAIQRKLNCPMYHSIRKDEWEKMTMERTQDMNDECPIRPTEPISSPPSPVPAEKVQSFVKALDRARRGEKEELAENVDECLLDHFVSLTAANCPPSDLWLMLNDYFRNLPLACVKPRKPKGPSVHQKRSVRIEKRWLFVRTQRLWRANRSRTARYILNGRTGAEKSPLEIPQFMRRWKETFRKSRATISTEGMTAHDESFRAWKPMYGDEIQIALTSMDSKTSSGPDGIKVSQLKGLPVRVLMKWFNLIMYCGRVPACLKRSITVFIPKKQNPESHSDYRPISMSSVILRLFNKILANRLLKKVQFDHRQRAFIPIDGCAENIALLEAMLHRANQGKSNLFLAMLDMKNAYGSVAHEAVFRALELKGADRDLVEYVKDLYRNYTTVLTSRGHETVVVVQRGILQGDPLSPILFNMVIDQILRVIPENVGFSLNDDCKVNGMAFADDLNVMTQSAVGMKVCLKSIDDAAKPLGLEFNAKKCSLLASIATKRIGMMVPKVVTDVYFEIGGAQIPMIKSGDSFRYLGAYFSSKGMVKDQEMIGTWLERLKAARLMPSQKLYVLRTHLIPKLIHRLTFAKVRVKELARIDCQIRTFLKGDGILRLPNSTPTDYFYAAVTDGGLGLMSLRRSIPAIILNRFERLQHCGDPTVEVAAYMEANSKRIRDACGALVNFEDILGNCRTNIQAINRGGLYEWIDASGLQKARVAAYAHQWLSSGGTEFLGNRTFIEAVKMRINALPTKSRMYRGMNYSRQCRAGCHQPETNEHMMQSCVSTRPGRRERHNQVVATLATELEAKDYKVLVGPTIRAVATVWYPDIIAMKGETAYVVDARIIGDQVDFAEAYRSKVKKYREVPSFSRRVLDLFPEATQVKYGALIINRKGVLGPMSEVFRKKVLRLTTSAMQRVVLECIRGSIRIYHQFVKGNKPYRFKGRKKSSPG